MPNKEVIVHQIDNVLKNIAMRHIGILPQDNGWEEFIANNPSYVQHEYGTALKIAEGARSTLERLPEHKQRVGGAIVRFYFTNEQIESIYKRTGEK